MKNAIEASVQEVVRAANAVAKPESIAFIDALSTAMVDAFARGNKVLIAGNGGSLCDAMHFAEELTGFYRKKRRPFPAIALSDPGAMSCISNDASFDEVFSRQVAAYGKSGDLFIALTTSGNSANLVRAVAAAHKQQMMTVAFLGKEGGKLGGVCNLEWIVRDFPYSDRIQEAHMASIHITIEMMENKMRRRHRELIEELAEHASV